MSTRGDVIVTPLTDRWNKNYMPNLANGEEPVPNDWFWAGDVTTMVIRPELNRDPIVDPVTPQPREVNVRKFFPGGVS